jgi:hypothetical protein
MFFIRYLWHELRRRMHQAVFIALGLAVGIGLVITVSSASAGVNKAESGVLSALYGLGTNVTATGPAVLAGRFGQTTIRSGPNGVGVEACQNGRCENAAGQTVQNLAPQYSPVTSAEVAAVARLHDVSAAADGLLLTDAETTFPPNYGRPGGPALPLPSFFSVDGVDTGHPALGPLSAGTIISGHSFTAADAGSDVAVVDSGYAAANGLRAGSAITIDGVRFTVIGIVRQSQGNDDVYIPLEASQALKTGNGDVEAGEVLGESLAMGIAGAAAGTGLGFAATAIIAAVAPKLSTTIPGSSAASSQAAAPGGGVVPSQNPAAASHVVAVPLHPSITVGVIALAVILSVAGGLMAGLAGSWRIANLRPADALARVA